jgi:2-polyprenyl-3-methyl-5-hydroxy-6-metoxy-1,4-benzoquinol methylase
MQRVCEPELMDDAAQALAYAEADFSVSDAAFSARILALWAEKAERERARWRPAAPGDRRGGSADGPPLRVVDLGCGPGNISFLLARACPHATVLGLDGSAPMLAIAAERLRAEPSLAGRLSFRAGRLPLSHDELEALGGGFDLLVSNSLLHHLADPQVFWRELGRLAAPGAWLVLRDLRRPASPAAVKELVARHAAAASPQLRHDFEASLHAAFRLEEVRDQLRAAGLEGLRLAEREDRYLDVWGPLQRAELAT